MCSPVADVYFSLTQCRWDFACKTVQRVQQAGGFRRHSAGFTILPVHRGQFMREGVEHRSSGVVMEHDCAGGPVPTSQEVAASV